MTRYTIARSGREPIQFDGMLLAQVSGGDKYAQKKHKRWHTIDVYATASGKYVAHVGFRCDSRYDAQHDDVEVCGQPADVVSFLSSYQPTACIRGWPLPQHREHDARLRAALNDSFEALVAEVLSLSEVFAERV